METTTTTNRTDKKVLVNGLKFIGAALICMFTGPTLIYISQTKVNKTVDHFILIIAIIICGLAIFFTFKGINIILNSMFKKNKN